MMASLQLKFQFSNYVHKKKTIKLEHWLKYSKFLAIFLSILTKFGWFIYMGDTIKPTTSDLKAVSIDK